MQKQESRDGWHHAEDKLSVGGAEPIDEPVALAPELVERLRLDEGFVLLGFPLGIGEGGRHHRHHLVLLTPQMRKQHVFEVLERVRQSLALAICVAAFVGGGGDFDLADRGRNGLVVRLHGVEDVGRSRVALPYQWVQDLILARVMLMKELHHPSEMAGDRLSLRV